MIITENTAIDVFIASKIGSFKHLKYHTEPSKNNKRCIENLVDIKTLEKDDSITSMVWADDEQIEIMLGRKNQQIQIYNTQKDAFTRTYKADFGAGHIVGLGRYERKIIAGLASGVVRIWSKKSEVKIETGAKMDRLRQCPDEAALFATGGEENDLKIWRIGEEAATFSAKNLPNDWLQLRRPVWVSDLTFLPGSGGCLAAVCSRHGYVRLYDSRAQRRPVSNVDFENMAATCIAPSFDERQVLVGFGRGQLHQVDLRQNRRDKGYKGAVGAVTDVVAVTTNNRRLVVSAGLDRTLRVHEWESKSLVYKQYLTSKLACVLVQTKNATPLRNPPEQEVKSEDELKEESLVEVDDMDELFDNMETVGEKLKKKLPPPADSAKRVKPSTDGSTVDVDEDEAIAQLLRSTERQKKIREKRRKEKKAKSVFHNA